MQSVFLLQSQHYLQYLWLWALTTHGWPLALYGSLKPLLTLAPCFLVSHRLLAQKARTDARREEAMRQACFKKDETFLLQSVIWNRSLNIPDNCSSWTLFRYILKHIWHASFGRHRRQESSAKAKEVYPRVYVLKLSCGRCYWTDNLPFWQSPANAVASNPTDKRWLPPHIPFYHKGKKCFPQNVPLSSLFYHNTLVFTKARWTLLQAAGGRGDVPHVLREPERHAGEEDLRLLQLPAG